MKINWVMDSSGRVSCHNNDVIGLKESYVGRVWLNDDGTWGAGHGTPEVSLGTEFKNAGIARRAVEAAVDGTQVSEWD